MAKTISADSELRVIRTICEVDGEIRTKLLSVLTTEHFASPVGSQLFERILGLIKSEKPIPRIANLKEDTALDDDAKDALTISDEKCVDENDALSTTDLLERYRKMRVVYVGAREVVKNIAEAGSDSIEDSLDSLERVIVKARSGFEEQNLVTSGSGSNAEATINEVLSKERPKRVLTGFLKFDEATGGFARKDLVLIAANSGGGKSIMAEQLAINAYVTTGQFLNAALVSFEMDPVELYARLMANLTQRSFENIYLRKWTYSKEDDFREECRKAWEKFNEVGKEHGNKFTIYCPTIDVTPSQVGALLRPGGYDLIIIDYVGLVASEKQAQLWENLGEITRQFKGVARRNNCVVAVMAQMDEESKKIKYSKAMQHHSSYVWRWDYDEQAEEAHQILVNQDKTRHCKRFPFSLVANFETMSFNNFVDECRPQDVTSKEESERLIAQAAGASATNQPMPTVDFIEAGRKAMEESRKVRRSEDEASRLVKKAKSDRMSARIGNAHMAKLSESDE